MDGSAPGQNGAFGPCTSPLTLRIKRGRHDFRVRAVLAGVPDDTPAEQRWRVKRRR